jgi:hypothetical protein
MQPSFFRRLFAFGVFIVAPALMVAQTNTGTIAGVVKDPSEAVVAGAKVTFRSLTSGLAVTASTDAAGQYTSPPLRPDPYSVTVMAAGFRSEDSKVNLEVSQRAVLDFVLEVGQTSETVTVASTAPLLDSESATIGSVQDENAVKNLPLNTRNFNQLIGLATGVVPAQTQTGSLAITAARGTTANSVNGIGFRSNNYRVDGVDNSENHNGQGILIYPPVEAIQEFRVETSVPAAEFGRGGGTINVVYKSGGQQFHGDLFEFFRNSQLDAKNYFDPAGPIAPFHLNQYGATIGGPVLLPHYNHDRLKTFFFFSWEAERRSQALSYLTTVPTAAFRGGDFSASPTIIYDPLTAVTLPNGKVQRTAFPGNKVPASYINPTGQNLMNLFPNPNLPGLVSNYASNPAATVNRDNFDIKVDQNFSARDQAFFRYSHQHTDQNTPGPLPLPAIGSTNAASVIYPLNQLVAGYTRTFTPNLIDEARAAFTRLNTKALNPNYGSNVADKIGIPGVNSGSNNIDSGLTQINLAGYATIGDSGFYPAIIVNNNFQVNNAVTWVHEGHTFKFGGEILRRQENVLQSSALHGIESFGPIYTTNPASPSGTGISLADLLLGAPASGNIGYVTGTVGQRRTDFGLFAQDTWKVTPALTLNLGLRYDVFPEYPFAEVANRSAYFTAGASGGVYDVGSPQIPWRSGVAPRYNDFGPRMGLAYRLGGKTVVRAAYGIFFAPDPGMILGNTNPPFNGSISFTNNQFDFLGATLVSQGFNRPANVLFSPLGGSLIGIDQHLKTPTASQWNASVERNLPGGVLLTTAYVGTAGRHLLLSPNINQPTPGPGAINPRRPYSLYSDITWNESSGSSDYNSLQVSAQRRLGSSLNFQASYTWSHAIDFGGFVGGRQNFNDLEAERGNADTDLRNRFVLSAVWQIPYGYGRRFGASGPRALDWIAGGWQVNTISSIYSGLPFTPTSSVNTLNTGGSQRPNRVASGELPSDERTIQRWFDITAFQTPGLYQYGNSGRNILFGPGTVQFDIAVAKSFYFSADRVRNLEFRAESFNIANSPQFNNPGTAIGSAGAGVISSAGSPVSFQRTSREIQLALKLKF